jgi:hypothetical protein
VPTKRPSSSSSQVTRPGTTPPTGIPLRRQAATTLGEEIDLLAKALQQLKIDFERFFAGALPFPPDELRGKVQLQIRALRGISSASAVDSFRLSDLEARYNSYNELFSRRLRDNEEGRRRVGMPPPSQQAPRFDARQGILVANEAAPQAIEALYQGLVAGGDAPRFDLASFGSYITRQASAIRQKTGCASVQFRLVEEEGKLKLKARPVAGSSS